MERKIFGTSFKKGKPIVWINEQHSKMAKSKKLAGFPKWKSTKKSNT